MKNYYTTKDLSEIHGLTTRCIRKRISNLSPTISDELLFKDENDSWKIHEDILDKFKPIRDVKKEYYALTIDPCTKWSRSDIELALQFACDEVGGAFDLFYTVEDNLLVDKSHIHCYTNCQRRKKLITSLRLAFSQISFHESEIFDLEGWKQYITKQGQQIKQIYANGRD